MPALDQSGPHRLGLYSGRRSGNCNSQNQITNEMNGESIAFTGRRKYCKPQNSAFHNYGCGLQHRHGLVQQRKIYG